MVAPGTAGKMKLLGTSQGTLVSLCTAVHSLGTLVCSRWSFLRGVLYQCTPAVESPLLLGFESNSFLDAVEKARLAAQPSA